MADQDRASRLKAMEEIAKTPRPKGPRCSAFNGTGRGDIVDPYDAHFNLSCQWCGGTGRKRRNGG